MEPSLRSTGHKEVIIRLGHMGHRLIRQARKGDRQLGIGIPTIAPGRAAGWAVARILGTQKVLATLDSGLPRLGALGKFTSQVLGVDNC